LQLKIMMTKTFPLLKIITLATTFTLASLIPLKKAQAANFEEAPIASNNVVLMAIPLRGGTQGYNLMVVEQIPGQQQCWSESGQKPVIVNPLFLNFDFSQACKRSGDSNGYSIRVNSQDVGLDYLLRVIPQGGELHLVGTQNNKPIMHIGRTYGMAQGALKIFLDSGWNVSRRSYQGNLTGHVYISGNSGGVAAGIPPQPTAGVPPQPTAGVPPQPTAGVLPQPTAGVPPQPTAGVPPQPTAGVPAQAPPGAGGSPIMNLLAPLQNLLLGPQQ
jgi:N-acetylmuramoyl-L-alanine amidase